MRSNAGGCATERIIIELKRGREEDGSNGGELKAGAQSTAEGGRRGGRAGSRRTRRTGCAAPPTIQYR